MNEICRMWNPSHKDCSGLNEVICKGDCYNTEGKCNFYKDQATFVEQRTATKKRLKEMGMEVLLRKRSEK